MLTNQEVPHAMGIIDASFQRITDLPLVVYSNLIIKTSRYKYTTVSLDSIAVVIS